ncbi:hypothetical protein ACHAXT_005345 [Thalassiosira profunda]
MVFSLSFGGVQVRISPSPAPDDGSAEFCIKGVQHLPDGRIEAEVCNFNGKIIISEEHMISEEPLPEETVTSRDIVVASSEAEGATSRDAVPYDGGEDMIAVDAIPEAEGPYCLFSSFCKVDNKVEKQSSFLTANSSIDEPQEHQAPYVPPPPQQQLSQLTVEIDSGDDDEEKKVQSPESNGGGVRFDLVNTHMIEESSRRTIDLSLHKACASEDIELEELRDILRANPDLASYADEFGDYPAHIFANNDAFIYCSSTDFEVQQWVFELYTACPRAFLSEGYDGEIPFAGTIRDWVDDCHQIYSQGPKGVERVSEIRSLTKSTRVVNSLCVRAEVQKLLHLPSNVKLTPKVMHSFTMLSFILDKLSQNALMDIPARKEFWSMASKRRDKIIGSVASLPFLVRTILFIDDRSEKDDLLDLSIVKNVLFRPESVDLWLVALLSGGERARACAMQYLCLISRSSLSGLFGRRVSWAEADAKRFHARRAELYDEVGTLQGFLPCCLHLGDKLYECSTRRAVKYAVENTIGKPLPVYLQFMEMFLLLILMTSYRIIVELAYEMPYEDFLSQYREYWGLALSIAVYFGLRDLAILASFSSMEEKLAMRYLSGFRNIIGFITTASVITVLSMIYVNSSIDGFNFVGIVAGLLWWTFLLHLKGMSENLSTLIYTIIQIAGTLKWFVTIFCVAIFFFADMVDIVKKTSGDCEFADGEEVDSSLETFCSLTPLQTYLGMYGILIGAMEISQLDSTSALISLLLVAASFSGVIVLVNILIAIVTREYEKAQERSCKLFARARLEAAARHVARERLWNPPDDDTSGIGRKLWRGVSKIKYLALTGAVEYFLIKSLLSSASLHRDQLLGDFLYVALIMTAVLHHLFVAAALMYIFARCICNYDCLSWLRGSKFHLALLNICLKPVCRYLSSVGLGKGESCPDASDTEEDNTTNKGRSTGDGNMCAGGQCEL